MAQLHFQDRFTIHLEGVKKDLAIGTLDHLIHIHLGAGASSLPMGKLLTRAFWVIGRVASRGRAMNGRGKDEPAENLETADEQIGLPPQDLTELHCFDEALRRNDRQGPVQPASQSAGISSL